MLNMRDSRNRKDKSQTNGRAVAVTRNWGKSWDRHPSDHRADLLPEPDCMASLIQTKVGDKFVLIFSNPNNRHNRKNLTVKASLDSGNTWPADRQIELDSVFGAYSCLTRVNNHSIGILYESSQGYLVFQKLPLHSIVKSESSHANDSGDEY